MNKRVELLLKESEDMMNAHSTLYFFRLSNICIEAKAIALLSTTIKYGGFEFDIENVADVQIPNKKQYAVYPKKREYIMPIIKGVKKEHPEFMFSLEKQEDMHSLTAEEMKMLGLKEEDIKEVVDDYILFTIPDVDDERYDIYNNLTNTLHTAASVSINKEKQAFLTKSTKWSFGATTEDLEEINNEIDKHKDKNLEDCDRYKDTKLEEIETAYQLYLTKLAEKQDSNNSISSSGDSMNMSDEE